MIAKEDTLPVRTQCAIAAVNRSTWYYQAKEEPEQNVKLMNLIDEIHLDHPTWGSRMIRDHLRNCGHMVNRKRIRRLMAIMRVSVLYPKRNLSKRSLEHRVYPYLLRDVRIERPNQVWSADVTYIRMEKGWAYLVAIIDWHSRAILAWRLSNTCDTDFCCQTLVEAISRYGCPEIFNTDQGATFTSPSFLAILQDRQIKISMDGKGRALDNVIIERFWRSLKQEEVYLKSYGDLRVAAASIGSYIHHYNHERPHAAHGGRWPMEVYLKMVA